MTVAITNVAPASVVAGAAPVTVTITGTGFLTAPTVVIGDLTVSSVVEAGGTSITCKVGAKGSHVRGPLDVTVTNTDATTHTDTGALSVVTPAVNNNVGGYAYANSLAGVTPGSNAVGVLNPSVAVETGTVSAPVARPYADMVSNTSARATPGMDVLNPAYAVTEESTHGRGGQSNQFDGYTMVSPVQEAGIGPSDRASDNPAVTDVNDDDGFSVGDEHSAQLPLAPTIGAVTSGSAAHATVHWTAPVDLDGYALTGFEVIATTSDGGTSPVTVEVSDGTATSVTMAGLTSAKHYTFKVAAKNIAGTGPQSAASSSLLIS